MLLYYCQMDKVTNLEEFLKAVNYEFCQKYCSTGTEYKCPVLFPGFCIVGRIVPKTVTAEIVEMFIKFDTAINMISVEKNRNEDFNVIVHRESGTTSIISIKKPTTSEGELGRLMEKQINPDRGVLHVQNIELNRDLVDCFWRLPRGEPINVKFNPANDFTFFVYQQDKSEIYVTVYRSYDEPIIFDVHNRHGDPERDYVVEVRRRLTNYAF